MELIIHSELRQASSNDFRYEFHLQKNPFKNYVLFLEKEKGTIEQRLNTVQAIANKRLDVTTNHLRAVHEALHGRPLNEVLTNIAKEIDPNFRIKQGTINYSKNRKPSHCRTANGRKSPSTRKTGE
ncbi:hypothetical protein KHA80_02505 [Anaerobacillus sp. HL2]|nr:hypothetical protein KHA80_02505 [Anaerobacillus sp. HL2]